MNKEHEKRMWILQRWANKTNTNYHLTSRFMRLFSYKELCRPFIEEDNERLSWNQLATKYKLTYREIRTILEKCEKLENA